MSVQAAPPSYAEATAGDKEHVGGTVVMPSYGANGLPPMMSPPSVPCHASWTYMHPRPSESFCGTFCMTFQNVDFSVYISAIPCPLFVSSFFPLDPGYTNHCPSDISSHLSDPSTSSLDGNNWEDKNIRRMFIRKVRNIKICFTDYII